MSCRVCGIPKCSCHKAKLTMPAYVLSQWNKRVPLVKAFLDRHGRDEASVTYYDNPAWEIPPGTELHEVYRKFCVLQTHYRVFLGHQAMMKLFLETGEPIGLFFEDDAVPNIMLTAAIVNACAADALANGDCEVFATYGRHYDRKRFNCIRKVAGREILRLKPTEMSKGEFSSGGNANVLGSLAYLVTRSGAEKFSSLPWEGVPVDARMPDVTNFIFMHQTPWNHDRRQGSLVEQKPK